MGILRKARLEISSKTLQRIRTSHQNPSSPSRSGQPGYITCAICETTKYYSHVQRRYGVFSCEPCSKFFARFLKHPQQLFCARIGVCSLDNTSGRCRACWLSACLKTFQMEEQLRREMSARFAPRLSSVVSSSLSSSLRVEIKNQKKEKPMKRGEKPLLMVAQSSSSSSGPRVKRVCRRRVEGLPVATFSASSERDNCSSDSDEMPVDVYLCRAVAERTQGVTSMSA